MQAEHSYLRKATGVVHIGANEGQERFLYDMFRLGVIWVEPIPAVFQVLKENISAFPKQRAFNYLVTDQDGKQYEFHVANNGGASSSIFDLAKHREMWPEITYTGSLTLTSITLGKLLAQENIDIRQFDALVLDTQGSEYTILTGANGLLRNFKFIKIEVADFESYKGCCRIKDVSSFMQTHGFRENRRVPFMHLSEVGTYFDVIYERVGPKPAY